MSLVRREMVRSSMSNGWKSHWNGAMTWVGSAMCQVMRLITVVSGDLEQGGIIWANASSVLGVGCTEIEAI